MAQSAIISTAEIIGTATVTHILRDEFIPVDEQLQAVGDHYLKGEDLVSVRWSNGLLVTMTAPLGTLTPDTDEMVALYRISEAVFANVGGTHA